MRGFKDTVLPQLFIKPHLKQNVHLTQIYVKKCKKLTKLIFLTGCLSMKHNYLHTIDILFLPDTSKT